MIVFMKRSLALSCAAFALTLLFPLSGHATTSLPGSALQVSQSGDVEKSCGALSQEAMVMRDIIYATEDIKGQSKMQSHGITAAGAVGSFLVGTVTGGIGLAAAGFLLDYNVGEKKEDADEIQDIAEQRRTLMMGIYNAKGCFGPIEHAMQNPEDFDAIDSIKKIEISAGESKYYSDIRRRYND